jgi:hypothetical protein
MFLISVLYRKIPKKATNISQFPNNTAKNYKTVTKSKILQIPVYRAISNLHRTQAFSWEKVAKIFDF